MLCRQLPFVFIRYKSRRGHRYYSVVKGIRYADTIKQLTVLNIGRLDNLLPEDISRIESKVRTLGEPKLIDCFWKEVFKLGYSVETLISIERSLHYGDVATLYTIAELLDIPHIVWENTTKGGGPDIGKVVTIMAVCQALAPTSKRDLRNWYEETGLEYLTGITAGDVEEWNLYSAMKYLTEERIESIEKDIVQSLIDRYDISLDTCLYDLTSTFFYGRKDEFKKHGYSRDYMGHLAQVVIGLALTKEDGIPLKHWVYPGNTPDVDVLPNAAGSIKRLYGEHNITLVFDRGNLSEKNVRILDGLEYDYICGLKRNVVVVKEIIRRAREHGRFEVLKDIPDDSGGEGVVYGTSLEADLWDRTRKVVVCYSEPLAKAEQRNREKAIKEAKIELEALQKKTLENNYSHDSLVIELHETLKGVSKYFDTQITDHLPTTKLSIHKTEKGEALDKRKLRWIDQKLDCLKAKVSTMTTEEVRNELKDIFGDKRRYYRYRVKEVPGYSRFTWELKEEVVERTSEFDGYYAIMSTDLSISMKDIIQINDSRDIAEKSFQTLKNPIKIRPVRHWVPQMVRAHIYVCILGYLLRQMLRFLMKRKGLDCTLHEALIALRRIKLIQIGENKENMCLKLTRLNDAQKELFGLVGLPHHPPTLNKGV